VVIFGLTGFIGLAVTKKIAKPRYKNIHCLYRNEEKKKRLFHGISTHLLHFIKGEILFF
jgi:saccharopine dehydrogenase-like NADP-dependent oxidoreductase